MHIMDSQHLLSTFARLGHGITPRVPGGPYRVLPCSLFLFCADTARFSILAHSFPMVGLRRFYRFTFIAGRYDFYVEG